jgi:hypothetical protein
MAIGPLAMDADRGHHLGRPLFAHQRGHCRQRASAVADVVHHQHVAALHRRRIEGDLHLCGRDAVGDVGGGGIASAGERGGSVFVTGGNSTGSGAAPDGGSVEIDSGTGQTNGTARIGAVNAEYVGVGRSGKDVLTSGRNVGVPTTYTPVAGTTIPVLCPVILLANTGAVDLGTAVATIQTSGITAGTRVTFIQTGAGTTTFRRGGSTLLKLSAASHAVALYHSLELVYSGAFWCEIAFANNA